jgi:phage FluMu protein Com
MKVKLASIYFAPLRAGRSAYNGSYQMPAVAKGARPAILEITDKVQRWQGSYEQGNGTNQRSVESRMIFGEQIAQDLILEWARSGLGMSEKIHPGIWMVREHVPELNEQGNMIIDAMGAIVWRTAERAERERMWEEDYSAALEADRLYAKYLIEEVGDAIVTKDARLTRFIPVNCKLAATHYGVARDWNKELTATNMAPCPFCNKIVSMEAIKCPECKEVVNVTKYAELMAQRESAIKLARRKFEAVPRQPVSTGLGIKATGPATDIPPIPTAPAMTDDDELEEELEEDLQTANA